MSEEWQRARLIPVSGITGADEQERRGVSALLAVMESVKEFGRALTALSAPNGRGGWIDAYGALSFANSIANPVVRPPDFQSISRESPR